MNTPQDFTRKFCSDNKELMSSIAKIEEIDGKYTIIETSSLNELKHQLTIAREALEFYSSTINWTGEGYYRASDNGIRSRKALAQIDKLAQHTQSNTPIPMGEEN